MRYFLIALLVVCTVGVCARSEDSIRGNYVGDWSGALKENALAGKYESKALAGGSAVDQGDWEATPAHKAP
jgi:hypothetical protein